MIRRFFLVALVAFLSLAVAGCPGGNKKKKKKKKKKTVASKTVKKGPPPKPFSRADVKSPWKYAKEGDYAIYNAVSMKKKMYFKVTKVEDQYVHWIKTDKEFKQVQYQGKTDLATAKYGDPLEQMGVVKDKVKDEKMDFAGKVLEVKVITRDAKKGAPTKNWVVYKGKLLPFMDTLGRAVVRSERAGSLEFELVEFGNLKDKKK